MFRNPVGEFSLSSRRSFRPVCEQLEQRIVPDGTHTTTSSMPQMADPAAFAQVEGLTAVVQALTAQLGQRALKASDGLDFSRAERVQRLGANLSKLVAALQQAEAQVVQSQASAHDPNFQFADILFRAAVDDFQTAANVAQSAPGFVIQNIADAAKVANRGLRVQKQFQNGEQAVENFINNARQSILGH